LERKEETREKLRALQAIGTDTIGNLPGPRLYFYHCPQHTLFRIATMNTATKVLLSRFVHTTRLNRAART
jgi:hypothetical protein